MSWNYRVMKKRNEDGASTYGVHEVYYNDDGSIRGYTENSVTPNSESAEDLAKTMKLIKSS